MGFRFAEVTQTAGEAFDLSTLNISSLFVSTGFDTRKDSSFECSHNLTNRINTATRVSARSNFLSFPTDCPQRERAGWLGDAHIGSETVLRNYDASGAYRLFVEMIAESLDDAGNPPDVVPFLGGHGGGGTPTWTAAFPVISALILEHGDEQIPLILYDQMKRFVEYGRNKTKGGGCFGPPDWGDWCPPAPNATATINCAGGASQVSCWGYFQGVKTMAHWAAMLGKAADASDYGALLQSVRKDWGAKNQLALEAAAAHNSGKPKGTRDWVQTIKPVEPNTSLPPSNLLPPAFNSPPSRLQFSSLQPSILLPPAFNSLQSPSTCSSAWFGACGAPKHGCQPCLRGKVYNTALSAFGLRQLTGPRHGRVRKRRRRRRRGGGRGGGR